MQAPQQREGEKGWSEDRRGSGGGAVSKQAEVGGGARVLLAPGEALQLARPVHLQMSGWRGPRCSPAGGAPGLASPQACKDRGVRQPPPAPRDTSHAHTRSLASATPKNEPTSAQPRGLKG